jgi:serine/threonine-protein kinase
MKIATSFVLAVAFALAIAKPVGAQSAEAETLFREGKRLLKKGDLAAACEKFEASERLEPSLGTELNLGDCREKNGQHARAWAMFVKAAAAAKRTGDDKREAEAKRRADTLEAQLVYLTIEVPDDVRVDELVIKRNDSPVDRELWNQRVPVDADTYTITAEAPGYKTWTETVTVKTKSKKIEVPPLKKSERKARDTQEPATESSSTEDASEEGEDRSEPSVRTPRRFTGLAIGLGVAGAAAIGTGVYFGLAGKDLERQSDALCPTTACADPDGVELNKRARRDALIANIGFIAGGAAVVGAVVLVVVGAPGDAKQVSIAPTLGGDRVGIALGGRF